MENNTAIRCPLCGSNDLTERDLDKFYCNHCGSEISIKRDEKVIDYKKRIAELEAENRQLSMKLEASLKTNQMYFENEK